MANRRCTGCKQDVGRYGIRHKYAGGVFCEQCMRSFGILHGWVRGFFGRLWDGITEFATSFFRPETPSRRDEKRREAKIRVHNRVMAARALTIPANPQTVGH